MSKKFNHAFTIAFSLECDDPTGKHVTVTQLTEALCRRIADLIENDEMHEAVGMPFDTFEVDGKWIK